MTTPKKRRASIRCGPRSRQCGNACVPRAKKCKPNGASLGSPAAAAVLKKENDRIRNFKNEEAVIIDPRTGRKKFSKAGDRTSVDFTGEEIRAMESLVITHNHPNLGYDSGDPRSKGFSFSVEDMQVACMTRCAEINAVSTGYDHVLKPPNGGWNSQFFNDKVRPALARNQQKAYNSTLSDMLAGRFDHRHAEVEFRHRWIAGTAADTGMKYKRTEVSRSDAYLSAFETYRADKGKPCGRGFIAERKKCGVGGGLSQTAKTREGIVAKKANPKPRTGRPPDSAVKVVVKAIAIASLINIGLSATVGLASMALEAAEKKVDEKEYEEAKKRAEAADREFRKASESTRQKYQENREKATEDFKKEWKSQAGENWDDFFARAQEASRRAQGSSQKPSSEEGDPWHQVLGVKPNATAAEIKKAYKTKARQFHPDINKDPRAEEIMKKVNDAFDRSGKKRGDAYTLALGLYRSDKGKPCGRGHIAERKKCHGGSLSQAGGLDLSGQKMKGIPKGAIAGIVAGAALLGIPAVAYLKLRSDYRSGFKKSAEMAKEASKKFDALVPESGLTAGVGSRSDLPAKQITLVVGGFAQEQGRSSIWLADMLEQKDDLFKDHAITAVSNKDFDVKASTTADPRIKIGNKVIAREHELEQMKIMLDTVTKEGRNKSAVNMAAAAYAYHKKYPEIPINLVGYSAGGPITHEASEILWTMGVKNVKVANLGSPYYGLTKKVHPSITLGSINDPELKKYPVRDRVNVNDVGDHYSYLKNGEARAKLKDFFDGKDITPKTSFNEKLPDWAQQALATPEEKAKAKRRAAATERALKMKKNREQRTTKKDSLNFDGLFDDSAGLRAKFLKMLKTLLERSYADGINQFTAIAVSPTGDVLGRFRDGQKLVDFSISKTEVFTQLVDKARRDADAEVYTQNFLRVDSGADKCVKGLSCGLSCINGKFSCRIKTSKLASAGELAAFRQSASSLRQAEINSFPKEPAKDKTIRELQKEARDKGVSYANRMNKEQLKRTLQAVDENPAQRARLEKSLTKKREAREAIAGTSFAKLVKNWDQFKRVMKIAGVRPEYAIAAGAALITKMSVDAYKGYSTKYRNNYGDSALSALNRAEKIGVVPTRKENIMFTVGGFAGEGSSGADMKKRLEDLGDKTYPGAIGNPTDMKDRWFRNENEIIAFDSPEFDIKGTDIPKKNPDGSYNPAYLGHLTINGMGTMLKNTLVKGRNEASVELAAQVYAHAKTPGNEGKPLNILTHSVGGPTADEAMQIISKMPNSDSVLKRINLVKMGAPNVGFISDVSPVREMSISAGGDPFNFLPYRNERRVNAVPGREVEDFMNNDTVIDNARTQFGYHNTSTYGRYKAETMPKRAPTAEEVEAKRRRSEAAKKGHQNKAEKAKAKRVQTEEANPPAAAPPVLKNEPAIETKTPDPNPKSKAKKDSGYLDGVQSWLRKDAEEPQKKAIAHQLIKRAIATTNPKITRVLTAKVEGEDLSGRFLDNLNRPHEYAFKDGYLTFKEVGLQREDVFGGDTCVKGTDCGGACVRRGSNCRTKLSGTSKKMVDQAMKILQTEQLPSRGETAKLAGALAVDFLKNPVKAVKEGIERERKVKAAIKQHTGEEVVSNLELIGAGLKKGSKKMKQYVADNPALVEDMVVNTGGLAGSIAGGALGPVGALAGDAGGALVVRKGLRDIKAVKSAQEKLKKDEAYQAMGRLGKLKTLAKASIQELKSKELREKVGDDLTGDMGGWAIGNAAAIGLATAGARVPLQGAAVAMALVPGVLKGRKKLQAGGTIREAAKEAALAVVAPITEGNKREQEMRVKASKYIGAIKRGALSKV